MAKSLHEVLKKHKPKEAKKPAVKDSAKAEKSAKHVVIKADNARKLFFDLPHKHKFWAKNGKEINNLTQLYECLVEMTEEIFKHHVTKNRDDFAKWVGEVLADTILARRMKSSRTKLGHVEAVRKRIEQLRFGGIRIPHPKSKLQANYRFIDIEKKKPLMPSLTPTAPGDFRMKGAPLLPDTTFITAHHRAMQQGGQYDEMIDSQMDMLETVKRDVDDQTQMMNDMGELKESYQNIFGEFNAIRNEMANLKSELQHGRTQQKDINDKNVDEMKETVRKLRQKEMEILGEMKYIAKTEEKIVSKNEHLMDKEAELEKKENLVLHKEKHYNKLMEKYDEMLKDIRGRMHADERKIQHLLKTAEPHAKHSVTVNEHHHRGDFLSDKSKESVKKMLNKTMSGSAHLLEQMEIEDLIKDTHSLFAKKQYKKVHANLDRLKEMLKSPNLNADFKKTAYFQVFELSTELDLKK